MLLLAVEGVLVMLGELGDASRVLPLLLLLESSGMRDAAGEGDG